MDINLNYIEKGSGVPLILLHGNGENHDYFVHQIDVFSKEYRVIAIDTRGHGQSPRGEAPFTIRQFVEDLYSFMQKHSIERSHLLGFSDGGNIALAFTLKYPELVEKLILNGANLNPKGIKRTDQIPIEIGYKIAKWFAKNNPDALKNAEMLGLMVNEPNIEPDELQKIQSKTLVIVGNKDMVKESHSMLIYNNIQNAQISIIKGGHFIANKNPDEFNRIVLEFLKK